MIFRLHTVVQMKTFETDAKRLFTEDQIDEILDTLAMNPEKGAPIVGTGGVRKWRFASKNAKGKTGGSRVIHYYMNENSPAILIMAYGKGDQDNLSDAEKNRMKKLTANLKKEYGK